MRTMLHTQLESRTHKVMEEKDDQLLRSLDPLLAKFPNHSANSEPDKEISGMFISKVLVN